MTARIREVGRLNRSRFHYKTMSRPREKEAALWGSYVATADRHSLKLLVLLLFIQKVTRKIHQPFAAVGKVALRAG